MGNQVAVDRDKPESLKEITSRFDAGRYLTPNSDVVALMVLEHQTQMVNLMVRVNFEVRHALHHQKSMNQIFGDPMGTKSDSTKRRIREAAAELVDYLLFVEEAPLKEPIRGSSGFVSDLQAESGRMSSVRISFAITTARSTYSKTISGVLRVSVTFLRTARS